MSSVLSSGGLRMALDDYRGLSAYEIAVKNGFEGSETEWLASLKGLDGKTHSVNGVEQIDGNILLTGDKIPISLSDARTLPEVAKGMDEILSALMITSEKVDLGGRYLDNAVFR
ncbi:MAG: hypothetical protein J6K55_16390 [Clostridia bacterium]|nr:hypothetical protein [Clostridia bacterium]